MRFDRKHGDCSMQRCSCKGRCSCVHGPCAAPAMQDMLTLTTRMNALARVTLGNVNISATTALQAKLWQPFWAGKKWKGAQKKKKKEKKK